MRSFRVHVVMNGLSWPTLPQKLSLVSAFYSPVLTLRFTHEQIAVPAPMRCDYPGLAPLCTVDFDWYDKNISLPHMDDADIVVLVSPQRQDYVTHRGVMTHCNVGPYEIQLAVGGETERVTAGKLSEDAFVHYLCHELAHVFYEDLGKRDDTHVHFPVGQVPYVDMPSNVLSDFWNYPDDRTSVLKQLVRQLGGALVALGIIVKSRSVIAADNAVPAAAAPAPVPTPEPEDPNMKLYKLAKASLGKDIAKTQDELGCAEAVSGLLNRAYGDIPAGVLSTTTLYQKIASSGSYAVTRAVQPLSRVAKPGDVILSPTGFGSDPSDHGHVGVAGFYGIMSNDSATGLFKQNYTFDAWDASFRGRGFPVFICRRKA